MHGVFKSINLASKIISFRTLLLKAAVMLLFSVIKIAGRIFSNGRQVVGFISIRNGLGGDSFSFFEGAWEERAVGARGDGCWLKALG